MGKGPTRRRYGGSHPRPGARTRTLHPSRWTLGENASSQPGGDLASEYRPCQNFRNPHKVLLRSPLGGPAAGGTITYSARGEQNVAIVSGFVGVHNMIAPEIGGGNPTVTIFRLGGR